VQRRQRSGMVLLTTVALGLAACGAGGGAGGAPGADGPRVVVTTNILGDVVGVIVGDDAELEVVMPVGSVPHEFEPAAQQASSMRDADALITSGDGFEEGLVDAIEAAEADDVAVFEAASAVETLELGGGEAGGSPDPHWFTDPVRMATAAQAIAEFLVDNVEGLDADDIRSRADDRARELRALSEEMTDTLSSIPEPKRKLVTNHEVFGYFAERFDFEVVGALIPGGTTLAEPSAAEIVELADLVVEEDVPAIFADSDQPDQLAESLAEEVGRDVEIVALFTESLGDDGSGAETYVAMMRQNAERIAEALSG